MLQESGMNGSSSKKPNSSGSSKVQPKEEAEESCELDRKIRCPCGCDVLCGARPLVQVNIYRCF